MSINQKFSAGFSFIKKVSENECVEFKRAKNNFDVDTLGKYFSALGNEANLKNKLYSWIIFGVDDKTHELTSTNYCIDNDFVIYNNLQKNEEMTPAISSWRSHLFSSLILTLL